MTQQPEESQSSQTSLEAPIFRSGMDPFDSPEERIESLSEPFFEWYELAEMLLAEGDERSRLIDERSVFLSDSPEHILSALEEKECGPESRDVLIMIFGFDPAYDPISSMIARNADDELAAALVNEYGTERFERVAALHYSSEADAYRAHMSLTLGNEDGYDDAINSELERRGL